MDFNEIIILSDILRLPRHSRQYIPVRQYHWEHSAESFYHICRFPIEKIKNCRVRFLYNDTKIRQSVQHIYEIFFKEKKIFYQEDWISLRHSGGTDYINEYINNLILNFIDQRKENLLILGFELSPLFLDILNACGLSWLNTYIHPASFMYDLNFAFATNVQSIKNKLGSIAYQEDDFKQYATWQIARYAPNCAINYLPENSLLLVSEGWMDLPPLSADGRLDNFISHRSQIQSLAEKHEAVFVLSNQYSPYDEAPKFTQDEISFLRDELSATMLPHPAIYMNNAVMLFAHNSIKTVAGLSSRRIDEATYFNKKTTFFSPKRIFFYEEDGHVDRNSFFAMAPKKKCFNESFWKLILRGQTDRGDNLPDCIPNIRLIFRGGGSDFDDSKSFVQMRDTSQIKNNIFFARNDTLLQQVAHDIENSNASLKHNPDIANIRDKKNLFCIYCAADENYIVPAIISLKSTQKRIGLIPLYLVTYKSKLSQKSQKLLESYDINILDCEEGETLGVGYLHTTPIVYAHLFAPEMLLDKGFEFSIGLHADVICIKPFAPEDIFTNIKFFGATNTSSNTNFFGFTEGHEQISVKYEFNKSKWFEQILNPGVIFANNRALKSIRFTCAAKEIHKNIGQQILYYNEESILNLFNMRYDGFCRIIDTGYNFLCDASSLNDIPCFVHFVNDYKPWKAQKYEYHYGSLKTPLNTLFSLWHQEAFSVLGESEYRNFVNKFR